MSALKVVRDGHVLRVTLAKPERRNAFDAALIAELADAKGREAARSVSDTDGPNLSPVLCLALYIYV
jgi:enoyl-CoA hydratase/carnithine racemase